MKRRIVEYFGAGSWDKMTEIINTWSAKNDYAVVSITLLPEKHFSSGAAWLSVLVIAEVRE